MTSTSMSHTREVVRTSVRVVVGILDFRLKTYATRRGFPSAITNLKSEIAGGLSGLPARTGTL
jgi:hypothetical protein